MIGLLNFLVELFAFPIARVRTVVYTSFERDSRLLKTFLMILRAERFSGLYKGFGAWSCGLAVQHLSLASLWYGMYAGLGLDQSITAGLAGALVSAVVYPFDTVVRRYQIDGLTTNGRWHDSPRRLADQIWNKQGFKGFYNGYPIYLFTSAVGPFATIKCFEFMSEKHRIF